MAGTNETGGTTPNPAAIRDELARLVAGPLRSAPQLGRFLTFVVEEALAGRGEQLKEYTVGVQGLGRPATFDPASDASVRVAARQLRFKLAEHYAREAAAGEVTIDLPKGGYVPAFSTRAASPALLEVQVEDAPSPNAAPAAATSVTTPTGATNRGMPRLVVALVGLLAVVGFGAWRWRASDRAPGAAPVIAVLPFENLTGASDGEILSDGLSDEITSALARDTGTRVIARTSAWKFRSQRIDVRDVGRQLGATHIVEGSVRRSGDTYRVSVQVNATADGLRVWAEQYEVDRASAFGLYDLISQNVHRAILGLSREVAALPSRRTPADPAINEWMLEARYFWNQRTDSGLRRATDLFTRATRADPRFAPAWAALAGVYATMEVNHVTPPGRSAPLAIDAAERALALDSTMGEAWAPIGLIRGFHEWRWLAADTAFQHAVELAPSYATARSWYSNVLLARGDVDAALVQLEDARRLDPLSLPIAYGIAQAYYYGKRWDQGLVAVDRVLALNPDFSWGKLLRGKLLKGAGRVSEARQLFAQLADSMELALLDSARRTREVPRLIAGLPRDVKNSGQFWIATHYAQIGWPDSAFAWLERAYDVRQSDLSSILVDPMIDPVKQDPRYRSLVGRLSLGPAPVEAATNR
ncbi:MAG: hypothetical protein JNL26_11935 [Gemmatimonadetes bacterium]|nr:hypothetical protein [Gemmatimonadota bacterium]